MVAARKRYPCNMCHTPNLMLDPSLACSKCCGRGLDRLPVGHPSDFDIFWENWCPEVGVEIYAIFYHEKRI